MLHKHRKTEALSLYNLSSKGVKYTWLSFVAITPALQFCQKENPVKNKTTDNFTIQTSNTEIEKRFFKAKIIADSIASKAIFPEKLGNFYCRYHFEYYDKQKYNDDSIYKQPTDYHFTYHLLYEGDTIGQSYISVDSLLDVTYCGLDDFVGQRYFLEGKFKINKEMALKIGQQQGVDLRKLEATAEFIAHSAHFNKLYMKDVISKIAISKSSMQIQDLNCYWEVQNNCDGCIKLKVDAENGAVSDKQKMMFIY